MSIARGLTDFIGALISCQLEKGGGVMGRSGMLQEEARPIEF